MTITFLGTGTSQGVPVIGCKCDVCTSTDPHDTRLRTSLLIRDDDTNIVIDVGPDFRQQILNNPIDSLQAVLLTHEHNDHVIGLDDIRPFYFQQGTGIDYYSSDKVFSELKIRFPYAFDMNTYPGAPKISMNRLTPYQSFSVKNLTILPLPVIHGKLPIFAFRIGDLTYITDGSSIPDETMDYIAGSKVLVINALRKTKHYSHFTLDEAIDIINIVQPEKAFITHISHLMGNHAEINKELPEGIYLAHDGLTIPIK